MWLSTVGLIITLALGFLVVPCTTDAQQPVKLIGLLINSYPPSEAQWQQSPFRQKLRELGWHEGHNIAFERRYTEGQTERLPDLAAELVRLRPDIIATGGTSGARAAQQATTTIPIRLWGAPACLLNRGSSRVWHIPVAISRGWKAMPVGLSGKRLDRSLRKRCRDSPASRSSTIRPIRSLPSNSQVWRRPLVPSACSCSPWQCAIPTRSTSPLLPLSNYVPTRFS